jgi:hypothetical protein
MPWAMIAAGPLVSLDDFLSARPGGIVQVTNQDFTACVPVGPDISEYKGWRKAECAGCGAPLEGSRCSYCLRLN